MNHRAAASACIDRCTNPIPRAAKDYPHDVVILVKTTYPAPHVYTDTMAFHGYDAAISREYAKHLRREYKGTSIEVRRTLVSKEEYYK